MKKSIIIIIILLIVVGLGVAITINGNKKYCYDNSHRGVYPVNSYCEKCGAGGGSFLHKCTNPNGEEKYCRVCGKLLFSK